MTIIRRRHTLLDKVLYTVAVFIVFLSSTLTALAQDGQSQKRGFTPGGSFALSDIETINTVNGNMILNFPLGRLPAGRGGASASITAFYNSKLYDTFAATLNDDSGQLTAQNLLEASESGGWRYGFDYQVRIINRNDTTDEPYQCQTAPLRAPDYRAFYIWKVQLIFPDGSAHEFRPTGYSDISPLQPGLGTQSRDGYYNVSPWGEIRDAALVQMYDPTCGCNLYSCDVNIHYDPSPFMTYYSSDGTYMRLRYERNDDWTVYFPDGRRVTGNGGGTNRMYDRNNNFVDVQHVLNHNGTGHPAALLVDQVGRSTAIEFDYATRQDYIYSSGVNGEQLKWTVKWKTIYVNRGYRTTGATGGQTRGGTSWQSLPNYPFDVVDRIILPPQAGNLSYIFGYNGNDTATANLSLGFGELTSITMPSQALSSYQYQLDTTTPPAAASSRIRIGC